MKGKEEREREREKEDGNTDRLVWREKLVVGLDAHGARVVGVVRSQVAVEFELLPLLQGGEAAEELVVFAVVERVDQVAQETQ